jgi:hypothetical protein
MTGRSTSKTALTATMITGSTAAGEALPPHFQFPTKAQSEETMKINIEGPSSMPTPSLANLVVMRRGIGTAPGHAMPREGWMMPSSSST